MTDTRQPIGGPEASEEPATFPADADQRYFLLVEEIFVRLRGAPMLLSPKDWQVARSWRRRGIPIAVVREALEEVFAKRRERGSTSPVSSLRYCAPAVEKAWASVLELGPGAIAESSRLEPQTSDVASLLERLAQQLPETIPGVGSWRSRLLDIVGGAEDAERHLAVLDGELLAALESALPAEEREAMRDAARKAAARLAERIGDAELARLSERLFATRLRDRWQVPMLSLFVAAGLAAERASRDAAAGREAGSDAEPGESAERETS